MDFELKTVAGKRILYVMAVDAEYGTHLRAHISPLMTGVGPVEAAVVLTAALARLDASGHRPDLIVSLGSAGFATLEQTEVYQASSSAIATWTLRPSASRRGSPRFLACQRKFRCRFRSPASLRAALDRRQHRFGCCL